MTCQEVKWLGINVHVAQNKSCLTSPILSTQKIFIEIERTAKQKQN